MRSGQWTPSSRPLFRTSVCVLRGDWPPGGGGAGPASQPPHALWRVARLQGAYELSISGFLKND